MGLSPWRNVMCDTLCMLGEAAVRGLIDCICIIIYIIELKYWPEQTQASLCVKKWLLLMYFLLSTEHNPKIHTHFKYT